MTCGAEAPPPQVLHHLHIITIYNGNKKCIWCILRRNGRTYPGPPLEQYDHDRMRVEGLRNTNNLYSLRDRTQIRIKLEPSAKTINEA